MRFLFLLSALFVLILFCQKSLVRLRVFRLKKKIKNNPLIGVKQEDNSYYYKQKGYCLSYRIKESPAGIKTVQWLSLKRRLRFFEGGILSIKRSLVKFFLYQRWLVIFRPFILFPLIISISIFYFGLVETQKARVERLKWLVASAVGASPDQIQYIGDGWLEVSTQRKTAVDGVMEPVRYAFNPFTWFFSSQAGFVSRWRGEPFGYVTHPVVYNEEGEVWINKEGTWRHGMFTGGKVIDWDIPQGTGIRAGKVHGHQISTEDKKLHIQDE
ncbi:MAG: hypothetical protein NT066_06205 [Candidatus Omnitrophica bacterium]|nr:hypothetical protein [Candidatus Omnitrophota bacterium]